jgi:hypothetical protein
MRFSTLSIVQAIHQNRIAVDNKRNVAVAERRNLTWVWQSYHLG